MSRDLCCPPLSNADERGWGVGLCRGSRRYPRLLRATAEERARWKIAGAGYGIHWPDLDEDLSTEGLLRAAPAAAEPAAVRR